MKGKTAADALKRIVAVAGGVETLDLCQQRFAGAASIRCTGTSKRPAGEMPTRLA
ncbi:MAG TPA: hypothetical protein VGB91_12565 [Rhizomicrobium sp.]